ncbi:hypothetical protein [Pedobacter aquatilis]|uniref:hypothetical protein n=1 Tax=Pedobacter aquatilis TaxID=351343 RepID=UPI00292CCDB7|nr:hypothetical protein [Pedobacter aquatilis]
MVAKILFGFQGSSDRVLPMGKKIAANSRTALAQKHQNCFTENNLRETELSFIDIF